MSDKQPPRGSARDRMPRVPVEHLPASFPCAEWVFKLRRMRDQVLGGSLFGEPAWDALLLLAAGRERGECTTIGQLMLELRLPDGAARRVIANLQQAELIEVDPTHSSDPLAPVALTEEGYAKLSTVLG